MSSIHCVNNAADRTIGKLWEGQFMILAGDYGKAFTPFQIGRQTAARWCWGSRERWNYFTLPDVCILTAPGEHHEIKHKNPTRSGMYGLEKYRLDALVAFAEVTQQTVYYTIHDHDKAGGREVRINKMEHWVTANVCELVLAHENEYIGSTWWNGEEGQKLTFYWDTSRFMPLHFIWPSKDDIPF